MRLLLIGTALLLSCGLGSVGNAQTQAAALARCEEAAPARAIAGCSALIDSGSLSRDMQFQAYFNRGIAYSEQRRHIKAMADFDRALKLRPRDPDALQGRCWARSVAGRLTQALEDCNRALALRPADPDTLEIRGFTHRKMRNFAAAIADYDAALAVRPDGPNSLFGRGIAKQDMGGWSEGGEDIVAARQLDPEIGARYTLIGIHR